MSLYVPLAALGNGETVIPEAAERIGRRDVSLDFCPPSTNVDHPERRIKPLAKWEAQEKEVEHADACDAG